MSNVKGFAVAFNNLQFMSARFPCVLVQGGVRRDKVEGDGATPLGMFLLRRVLYRHARHYLWHRSLHATAGAMTPRICFTNIRQGRSTCADKLRAIVAH